MTKKQQKALEQCTDGCIGKRVYFKHKGTTVRYLLGTVDDVVSIITADYNHMIQRIRLSPEIAREWNAKYAFRTCYYTLTRETRKPAWGQYHALVSEQNFRRLAKKANEKGWLGLGDVMSPRR